MIKHGYSRGTVAHNIRVEMQMGRSHEQAVAIALRIRDAELQRKHMRESAGNRFIRNSKLPHW
jgi:hypothetical protein